MSTPWRDPAGEDACIAASPQVAVLKSDGLTRAPTFRRDYLLTVDFTISPSCEASERRHCKAGGRKRRILRNETLSAKSGSPGQAVRFGEPRSRVSGLAPQLCGATRPLCTVMTAWRCLELLRGRRGQPAHTGFRKDRDTAEHVVPCRTRSRRPGHDRARKRRLRGGAAASISTERRHCKAGGRNRRSLRKEILSAKSGGPGQAVRFGRASLSPRGRSQGDRAGATYATVPTVLNILGLVIVASLFVAIGIGIWVIARRARRVGNFMERVVAEESARLGHADAPRGAGGLTAEQTTQMAERMLGGIDFHQHSAVPVPELLKSKKNSSEQ
jgi:hypothetical protein